MTKENQLFLDSHAQPVTPDPDNISYSSQKGNPSKLSQGRNNSCTRINVHLLCISFNIALLAFFNTVDLSFYRLQKFFVNVYLLFLFAFMLYIYGLIPGSIIGSISKSILGVYANITVDMGSYISLLGQIYIPDPSHVILHVHHIFNSKSGVLNENFIQL